MAKKPNKKEVFLAQLESAKRNQEEMRKDWDVWDQVYHGRVDLPKTTDDLLRSRLRIPWAWQQIETIIPRIVDPEPRFEFKPVEPSDERMSDVLNALIRYQLNADQFVAKQKAMIRDAMIYGMGVAKVIWYQKQQTMKVRRRGEDGQVIAEPKTIITENRPSIVYVDPYDFFPDPAATSDRNWRFAFHRIWLSDAELQARQKAGVYKNVDKVKSEGNDTSTRGTTESSEEAKARREGKNAVYERWGADGSLMVMSGDVVLRDADNPYYHGQIPFVCFSTQPDPRSLRGISEVDKIAPIQEAIWTRDNQRIDAVNVSLNPVFIVDPNIQGIRNLRFGPGAKIYAMNGQRVEQLQMDPRTAPAFDETQAYLGAMQQVTGASPYLAGADNSGYGIDNNTATGASIQLEEGNKRMAMKKLEFRLFLSRIAKMMVQLDHQYISELEVHRIVGDDSVGFKPIPPEEIPMFLDVLPEAMNESMSRSVERNSIIELLNITGGLHMATMPDGSVYTVKPLIESALKSYGREPRKSFPTAPMMPPAPPPNVGGEGATKPPTVNDQMSDINQVMG